MYIQKTVKAGMCIFVYKHYSARYGKKCPRSKNVRRTAPKQNIINKRISADKRIWTFLENFQKGDLWVEFNYRLSERPADFDSALANIQSLLRPLARKLKAKGIRLTYMHCIEIGALGGVHHHIAFKNNFDPSLLVSLWKKGKVIIDVMYSQNLIKLAEYFVKGSRGASEKLYTQSRNLKVPVPKVKILKSQRWKKDPVPPAEYSIQDLLNGYYDDIGYEFQRCIFRRNE